MVAMLVDVTKCTGCERCVNACAAAHGGKPGTAALRGTGEPLSADRLLAIEPVGPGRFARKSCLHCLEPSCVAACLVGGLTKTDSGPVVYDPDKCIGCRYCMLACPYHVPRYEWQAAFPYVKKCDLCASRLAEGRMPACVEACPNKALRFGDRDAMLAQAHDLIQAHPDRYLPRVWGEHEWGGASVVYVSDVDLAPLNFPGPHTAAIPHLTDPLIEKTPWMGTGVAFGLWALSAVIARRNQVMGKTRPVPRGHGGLEPVDPPASDRESSHE